MISKFRFFTFLIPLLILFLTYSIGLISFISIKIIKDSFLGKELLFLFLPMILIFSCWYMIFVLRFKCDKVIVNNDNFIIKKIFGLGSILVFKFNDIDFVPSWENVRIGTGKKLLICEKGKRISELSDLSYSNFNDLFKAIKKKTTLKSFQSDSYLNRLKDVLNYK